MNDNAIIRTVPAAGSLHQVPGFDPLKHLKRSVNDKGEPVMKLDLPYKRLWFRLACPNGRLLLNPLRITDQMAIFEAQVFFQREDTTPASSFTSTGRFRSRIHSSICLPTAPVAPAIATFFIPANPPSSQIRHKSP